MKTIELQLYEFNELSEKAKQRAIDHYRNTNDQIDWTSENENTLKAFENIFPVKITNWNYGGSRNDGVTFNFTESDEVCDLCGWRLSKYLWNNYKKDLYKGKYYSLWSKSEKSYKYYKEGFPVLKQRYSNILLDNCCPMTGYCMDDNILGPIYEYMNKPLNSNFYELLEECFAAWVKACNEDVEYQNSDEYISEQILNNNYEFTEDGNLY